MVMIIIKVCQWANRNLHRNSSFINRKNKKKYGNDNNKSMSNKIMKRIRAKVGLVLDGYAHWKLELSKVISFAYFGNFYWSMRDRGYLSRPLAFLGFPAVSDHLRFDFREINIGINHVLFLFILGELRFCLKYLNNFAFKLRLGSL